MTAAAMCAHRITIITGHYGTGKTEFAVNLALALARERPRVMLADLDIVNPYFRSRERRDLLAAQIRLNERETEQAPSSVLRLWRSFLGWVLALLFCWEVPVRLLLLPLLAPDLLDDLPPPALDQILSLLAGMLGLPF